MKRMHAPWLPVALLAGSLLSGCPDEPCVEDLDLSCAPLSSDVSWSNVFSTVIAPNSATEGLSCHSAQGKQGGLDLSEADTAYEQLVQPSSGEARVIPGDASCSTLLIRMESENRNYQMPPGATLSDPQRCMVQQWIHEGASP